MKGCERTKSFGDRSRCTIEVPLERFDLNCLVFSEQTKRAILLVLFSARDGRLRRQLHVPGQSGDLKPADDPVAHINLPGPQTVSRGSWKCMMRVMPTLTESEHAKDRVVAAFVIALKRLTSPNMTDGVDAPGDVVHKEDADESAPDETSPCATWSSDQQPADTSRDQQAHGDP